MVQSMTVSPPRAIFPPRKRRPSAGAFIPPNFADQKLVQSLLILSQEISSLQPFRFLLRRSSQSIIRKTKLLSILFDELIRNPIPILSPTLLCFEEMYILLQRIRTLIEDCSNGSKMWLLMQIESVANGFHELTVELSTLLDIFPVNEVDLSEDVQELVVLIRKQCCLVKPYLDPADCNLRREVLTMLDRIKREIVPDYSKLAAIFDQTGLQSAARCTEEIECLEDEVQNQTDEKSKSEVIALIGLVRYAKCVLYGATSPGQRRSATSSSSAAAAEAAINNIPPDFRCPISLDLMRDPVVVATGQTYDRESISLWIESGHNTCPKTGQGLAHTNLIPNRALKNLISMWCREQKIPFEATENTQRSNGVIPNKAAMEATRMTVSFLVKELSVSQSMEAANGVVYELRALAKTNSDSRSFISEAGAIPLLIRYLGSDVGSAIPNLQVNAVTTILNLSILESNKTQIMETDGALNGIIEVLRSGATWEAKGNAAATIFSLSGISSYRKRLGRKNRVIKGLMELVQLGPNSSKRDALVAILTLAGDRDTVAKLIESGAIEIVAGVLDSLPEEAITILEVVVKKGGLAAIAAVYNKIKKLGVLLREGSETSRESAAATLVTICRKGGSEMVAELAAMPGIERIIWELMGTGTVRARRKAATLLRILRRWAAGLDLNPTIASATTIM
ncbi:U-box domain-containing protein 16 [Linum perenne]